MGMLLTKPVPPLRFWEKPVGLGLSAQPIGHNPNFFARSPCLNSWRNGKRVGGEIGLLSSCFGKNSLIEIFRYGPVALMHGYLLRVLLNDKNIQGVKANFAGRFNFINSPT